jgi:hypothetical protein
MKRLAMCVAAAVIAVVAGISAPKNAEARMQYFKAFEAEYPKVEGVGTTKCGICHGKKGNDKKVTSNYAKELGKALGGKNVKDADKIKEALKKAEAGDAGDGKKFGDLLKDGKLPPAAE